MDKYLQNATAREGWRLDDAEWIEREKARQIAALKERFPEAFQEVQHGR